MLIAETVTKYYGKHRILDGVSFKIEEGELVSIVGPSGEGKSTIARILCGTVQPDGGRVLFQGEELLTAVGRSRKRQRRNIQLIMQQPYASLDPRQTVGSAVSEPLLFYKIAGSKGEARRRSLDLMEQMQLPPGLYDRRPGELSGGQVQRVLIARALTLSPALFIADEATSMLDMSSQAQIVRIFQSLVRNHGVSILFISHDWPLVESISSRIYQLSNGKLSELEMT